MKVTRFATMLAVVMAFLMAVGLQPASATVAVDEAEYAWSDGETGETGKGVATPAGDVSAQPPAQAASLRCWNPSISGRTFTVSCSGQAYRVFVDCSNRHRYVTPVLSGAKRVRLTCPAGTRALRGGAYGR
jgi:hypothetical protein